MAANNKSSGSQGKSPHPRQVNAQKGKSGRATKGSGSTKKVSGSGYEGSK